jgi:3-hydroxyisobutyrate dehydrogenase-like beta-hydroxyacid dehydrogenase
MPDTAGVIGLGEMGTPIVRHWLDEGYDVAAFDIDQDKVDRAADLGADTAETPAELGSKADVILIIVGTGDQVEGVLFDEDGVTEGLSGDEIIVVSSTVHPRRPGEWTDRLPDGVDLVDAPIARGRGIEERETTLFVGGEEAVVEGIEDLLEAFSEYVYHLGGVGTGQMGKTANNHLLWSCHTANYDALRLAKAFGVDTDELREGLKHSSGDNYALHRWEKATGKWAEDDLRIVFEMAEEYGVDIPQSERTRDAMEALEMEDIWALRDVDYRGASPSSN